MKYHYRYVTEKLQKWLELFPVIVVTGARQVGKSTLLQETLRKQLDCDFVVFDPVVDVENAREDPELFLNNHKTPLILDEIQYAPELVSSIKRKIDINKKPGQFILTGSQQWGVLKSISDSLAGRAVFLDLEGFSLGEIAEISPDKLWLSEWIENQKDFINRKKSLIPLNSMLYEQLWRGTLPKAHFLPLDAVTPYYQSYQRTYIERDVRLLADVSDLQLFGRFFQLAAAYTAQEINYSQLGREIGVTLQTSHRWLDILQATFQWHEVPAYSGNTIKRISGKPKGYIADTGIACMAQAISTPQAIAGHPLRGSLFETAVISEIRKQCHMMSVSPHIYHWRSHSGAEVDVILERDGMYHPIEIKAKSNPRKADNRGIRAFRETYPHLQIGKGLIIAPTERFYQISNDDYVLPWNTFLA